MKYLVLIFFLIASLGLSAQSSSVAALKKFQDTEFFTEFREMRDRSESAVRNFKLIENRYGQDEVAGVKAAYNSSAEYFNAILINIKTDLSNKKKRKFVIQYPDAYSKQIESDLYKAKEYYANTFQKEVSSVTNGQITGSALLVLIPEIIKYTKLAIQVVQEIDKQLKKMNEAILDQYLVKPNRFREWDEIN